MAPSRTYFARISEPNGESNEYVPIVRDPRKTYRMSQCGLLEETLWTQALALDDSMELMGTLLEGTRRPATVGDLRAGRAADVYWEIQGPPGTEGTAYWKTRTAVRWPSGTKPMDTASFAFKYVFHVETRKDDPKVLDNSPCILLHARKFREAMNKISEKPAEKPEKPEPISKKRSSERSEPRIDLERTDGPVDFAAIAAPASAPAGMVRVSRALYVLLNYGASPELLKSGPATYWVPAESLEHVSYGRFVDSVLRLESIDH